MPQVELNSPAPDFELQDYRGNKVQLSQFKDKQIVLLVFNRGFHVTILPSAYGAVASRL